LFDFVLAFFTSCYHLREWVERDDPSLREALDQLFRDSAALRLGADIANIAKHFDLTKPPRAGRQLSIAREYDPTNGWFGRDWRLVVLSRGDKLDMLDLITACEAAWTEFLRGHNRI
jgi:hypothetical protein